MSRICILISDLTAGQLLPQLVYQFLRRLGVFQSAEVEIIQVRQIAGKTNLPNLNYLYFSTLK